MNDKTDETVALIVRKEVALAEARGYLPLDEDGTYGKALRPIVASFVYRLPADAEEIAERFCTKIRVAEEARDKRYDLLPEKFRESLENLGYLGDPNDAVAAVLLMEEFAALTPVEIPAWVGERHLFDTEVQVVTFFEAFERWDTHALVTRLGLDHRFCVDVVES
jgi:hypothetical protein